MKLYVYFMIGQKDKRNIDFISFFLYTTFSLIYDYERQWTEKAIDDTASRHFTGVDLNTALKRPILFSDWLAGHYASIDEDELRQHIQGRLKV